MRYRPGVPNPWDAPASPADGVGQSIPTVTPQSATGKSVLESGPLYASKSWAQDRHPLPVDAPHWRPDAGLPLQQIDGKQEVRRVAHRHHSMAC